MAWVASMVDGDMRVAELPAASRLRLEGLTAREAEVALLAGRGLLVRDIADEQHVSQGTVKSLLKRAREKLGATNVRELSAILLREGLVTADQMLDPRGRDVTGIVRGRPSGGG